MGANMDYPGKIDISVCMGSSCFSRGSNRIISNLQRYIEKNKLAGRVQLKGCLCEEQCSSGPNIKINGTAYENVEADSVIDILLHYFNIEKDES